VADDQVPGKANSETDAGGCAIHFRYDGPGSMVERVHAAWAKWRSNETRNSRTPEDGDPPRVVVFPLMLRRSRGVAQTTAPSADACQDSMRGTAEPITLVWYQQGGLTGCSRMALERSFRGQQPWWRGAPDGFWDSLLRSLMTLRSRWLHVAQAGVRPGDRRDHLPLARIYQVMAPFASWRTATTFVEICPPQSY